MKLWVRWLTLALFALMTVGCAQPEGDEARIRQLLDEMATAVKDRNAGRVTSFLAEDFSGPSGMDRERARAFAGAMMARHSELGITWTVSEMKIEGDRATTRLTTLLTGQSLLPGMGNRGRLMNVQLGWRYTDGTWQVVNAQWSQAFEQ